VLPGGRWKSKVAGIASSGLPALLENERGVCFDHSYDTFQEGPLFAREVVALEELARRRGKCLSQLTSQASEKGLSHVDRSGEVIP
jgi:hypothetical protein